MFLLFLAFVVLLSGFVAYAADNIARRVGRKHLRLFGLRPKTTALIVAVASGMGISFASVLAFGLLNRQALRNIAQADVLRTELRDLRAELAPLRETVRQTEARLQQAQAEAKRLGEARDRAIKAREQAAREAQQSRAQRDQAYLQADQADAQARTLRLRVGELARRRDELLARGEQLSRRAEELAGKARGAETELRTTRAALNETRGAIKKLETQLGALEQARLTLQERVKEAQQREAAARTLAQQAGQQVEDLRAQLASLQEQARQLGLQNRKTTAESARLRQERDKAQQDVRAEQARRDALLRDNDALNQRLLSAQAERERLAGDVARATTELSATRTGDLVYEKGDLVHAQVVASVYNLPEAVSGAQARAAAHGARGNPAAVLPAAVQTRLRAKIRAMNFSAFVVFRSATNAVQGYPVELTADAFPNKVIYRHDQLIKQGSLRLGSLDQMRVQLLDLVSDSQLDLQAQGIPPEDFVSGGLSSAEIQSFLAGLRGSGSARVGIASRTDVRPGAQIDLYPTLLK